MTLQVTLSVSNRVVENAQRIAQQTKQPLEKFFRSGSIMLPKNCLLNR